MQVVSFLNLQVLHIFVFTVNTVSLLLFFFIFLLSTFIPQKQIFQFQRNFVGILGRKLYFKFVKEDRPLVGYRITNRLSLLSAIVSRLESGESPGGMNDEIPWTLGGSETH